jgi:hypothetical protein
VEPTLRFCLLETFFFFFSFLFFFEKLLETFYLVYFLTIPGFFWELGATLYALN